MSPALTVMAAPAPALPPQWLADLGAVLCLYRGDAAGELQGWSQAVRVQGQARLDSDGVHESLRFYDASGDCCWRLCLLPDSDFLAWDRLIDSVPRLAVADTAHSVGERLWQRLAGRLRGGGWRARVLRLHVLPGSQRQPLLAASPATVSSLGAQTARRIAQSEGSDVQLRVDDCCCARSAAAFSAPISGGATSSGTVPANNVPLIRLQPRKQP